MHWKFREQKSKDGQIEIQSNVDFFYILGLTIICKFWQVLVNRFERKGQTYRKRMDSSPAYNLLSVKQFLAKNRTTLLEYPPYSPELVPCNVFLFPKIKSALKDTLLSP